MVSKSKPSPETWSSSAAWCALRLAPHQARGGRRSARSHRAGRCTWSSTGASAPTTTRFESTTASCSPRRPRSPGLEKMTPRDARGALGGCAEAACHPGLIDPSRRGEEQREAARRCFRNLRDLREEGTRRSCSRSSRPCSGSCVSGSRPKVFPSSTWTGRLAIERSAWRFQNDENVSAFLIRPQGGRRRPSI